MESCPSITNLSLYWDVHITRVGVAYIAESDQALQLTTLNLSGVTKSSETSVVSIAKNCTNLTNLDLTRIEQCQ
jgi:hypothetical protein